MHIIPGAVCISRGKYSRNEDFVWQGTTTRSPRLGFQVRRRLGYQLEDKRRTFDHGKQMLNDMLPTLFGELITRDIDLN